MGTHDFLNKEVIGSYSPNCLYTRISSLFDLQPATSAVLHDAVAVHVHEYVHFLHNVSTCAGLHLLIADLWLLRSLPHATNEHGHFAGSERLTEEQQSWVRAATSWRDALLGAVKGLADSARFTIDLGYNFISEGIAYEAEREVRRFSSSRQSDLDHGVLPYPYLIYGALIDALVGRKSTPQERIDLGVFALLTTSPGASLIALCEDLGRTVRRTRYIGLWAGAIRNRGS